MATIRELLHEGERRLRGAAIEQPRREAALLLGHCLEMTEAALLAHDRDTAPAAGAARFLELVARRAEREPAAYLTGVREFWGRRFRVDDRVLVPRPESEHLVEAALALDLPPDARVLDVGTGSGCLAVTLAAERPGWRVAAVDRSLGALAAARRNGVEHGGRARWLAADLATAVPRGAFDLLISNPPYVAVEELATLEPEVRDREPRGALVADRGGFAVVERLLVESGAALTPGGWLISELGAGQGPQAAAAARDAGWREIDVRPDLAGKDRVLVARRAG